MIGHLVHLEGCTIRNGAMVANAAMVLHRSVIGEGAIVAANSVVLYDVDVPDGALAVGSPAIVKPGAAKSYLVEFAAAAYRQRVPEYLANLRRIG